ncbi:hypothetical protein BC828DRAFT_409584 [Blastocladiella britannica]|nr:hypothetical protein BC828DRAFT_409584 [Blastocladiella britannica]
MAALCCIANNAAISLTTIFASLTTTSTSSSGNHGEGTGSIITSCHVQLLASFQQASAGTSQVTAVIGATLSLLVVPEPSATSISAADTMGLDLSLHDMIGMSLYYANFGYHLCFMTELALAHVVKSAKQLAQ